MIRCCLQDCFEATHTDVRLSELKHEVFASTERSIRRVKGTLADIFPAGLSAKGGKAPQMRVPQVVGKSWTACPVAGHNTSDRQLAQLRAGSCPLKVLGRLSSPLSRGEAQRLRFRKDMHVAHERITRPDLVCQRPCWGNRQELVMLQRSGQA